MLEVTRQGFYDYLKNRDKPWKYEALAAEMMDIIDEDKCNDTYGRERMHKALLLKHPDGEGVPSEGTVYRVMHEIGISHRPKIHFFGIYEVIDKNTLHHTSKPKVDCMIQGVLIQSKYNQHILYHIFEQ